MRTIFGVALLGLSWAVGMMALTIGLDDLLLGRLNALFIWAGAVMTAMATTTLAEDITEYLSQRRNLLPACCPRQPIPSRWFC